MTIIFYLASVVAIISTLMVITRLNAVHALLYMILSLMSIALIFFVLGAPFIAALEIIIYAGAIMVLFVFVVMLLNLGPQSAEQERAWLDPKSWRGPSILAIVLLAELIFVLVQGESQHNEVQVISAKEVSLSLFGPYLLGVELASILLLAGLVGAYHLGRQRTKK